MNKTFIFLFILVSFLSGCMDKLSKENETFTVRSSRERLEPDTPLNFASLKKYILEPDCMKCHSGKDAKPLNDPIDFSTYETTMVSRFVPLLIKGKPEISRLFISVNTGEMPVKGTLRPEEIAFINKWIKACAPKETPTDIPTVCPGGGDDSDDDDDWDE